MMAAACIWIGTIALFLELVRRAPALDESQHPRSGGN